MSSSSKKRRVSRIESSDEDLPSATPENPEIEEDDDSNCRKSSRIKQRQNKVFQKPTRDEIWDKIPSSSEKDLSRITPTKKINNFTKVFSTYNAESYDLFNDDFIDDEEEIDCDSTSISTDSEEEEHLEKKRRRKKNKIKNRRKRLKFESSSSDEAVDDSIKDLKDADDGIKAADSDSEAKISTSTLDKGGNEKGDNVNVEGDNSSLPHDKGNNSDVKGGNSSQTDEKGDNLREESDILNKGDDSEIDNEDSDDESQILFSHSKNKTNIVESDSESEKNDEQEENSEENSEESDDDSESDNLSRAEKQLAEKQSKFQSFKEAQARLKEKQRRLSLIETVALKQK